MELQSKLTCDEELALPGRELVREGTMTAMWCRSKYFCLFNDMIIAIYDNIVTDKISLKGADLEDLPDQPALKNRFKINSNGKSYIFICSSPQEKQQWLADIKNKTIIPGSKLLVDEEFASDKTTKGMFGMSLLD